MTIKITAKRMLLSIGAGALLVAAGLAVSTPASADNIGIGINPYGFSLNYNSNSYYGRHNKHAYRQPYYGRRHKHRRHFNRRRKHNNYYYSNNYYQNGPRYANQGCQPTSKSGYWHGRQARIGGTMCYDAYGNGYIVQGSRYLIHYY